MYVDTADLLSMLCMYVHSMHTVCVYDNVLHVCVCALWRTCYPCSVEESVNHLPRAEKEGGLSSWVYIVCVYACMYVCVYVRVCMPYSFASGRKGGKSFKLSVHNVCMCVCMCVYVMLLNAFQAVCISSFCVCMVCALTPSTAIQSDHVTKSHVQLHTYTHTHTHIHTLHIPYTAIPIWP